MSLLDSLAVIHTQYVAGNTTTGSGDTTWHGFLRMNTISYLQRETNHLYFCSMTQIVAFKSFCDTDLKCWPLNPQAIILPSLFHCIFSLMLFENKDPCKTFRKIIKSIIYCKHLLLSFSNVNWLLLEYYLRPTWTDNFWWLIFLKCNVLYNEIYIHIFLNVIGLDRCLS
jgi:hypothetical protein